jgi:hypothetical protein
MTLEEAKKIPAKELASRLWDAGLAPEKYVDPLDCLDGRFFYWKSSSKKVRWTPASSLDDCFHLILRYRLHLVMWTKPQVVAGAIIHGKMSTYAIDTTDTALPATICRLALVLKYEEDQQIVESSESC